MAAVKEDSCGHMQGIENYYGPQAADILYNVRKKGVARTRRDQGESTALSLEAAAVRATVDDLVRQSHSTVGGAKYASTITNIVIYVWRSKERTQQQASATGNRAKATAGFWTGLGEVAFQSAAADQLYNMFSAIVDLGCKVPAPVLRIITASGFTALFLAALNIAREGRFATSGEAFMSFVNGATAGSNAAAINAACSTFLLGQAPYIFLAACLTALALNLAAPWLLQKPSPVPVDRMLIPSSFTPAPVKVWTLQNMWEGLLVAVGWHAATELEWDVPDVLQAQLSVAGTDLLCPISQQLFVKPVVLHSTVYELSFIEAWIIRSGKDAWGVRADVSELRPCPQMEKLVEQFATQHELLKVPA